MEHLGLTIPLHGAKVFDNIGAGADEYLMFCTALDIDATLPTVEQT